MEKEILKLENMLVKADKNFIEKLKNVNEEEVLNFILNFKDKIEGLEIVELENGIGVPILALISAKGGKYHCSSNGFHFEASENMFMVSDDDLIFLVKKNSGPENLESETLFRRARNLVDLINADYMDMIAILFENWDSRNELFKFEKKRNEKWKIHDKINDIKYTATSEYAVAFKDGKTLLIRKMQKIFLNILSCLQRKTFHTARITTYSLVKGITLRTDLSSRKFLTLKIRNILSSQESL